MAIRPKFTKFATPKIAHNIGSLLDIPTGVVVTGRKGEAIINGGLSNSVIITGAGNAFKSTLLHYMMLSAADKAFASGLDQTLMMTYDTEVNIRPTRLVDLASRFEYIPKENLLDPENGVWIVTDKASYYADEWLKFIKEYLDDKIKNRKALLVDTPFTDPVTKEPLKVLTPTFIEVDSISEFTTSKIAELLHKNELGSSGNQTMFMKHGLVNTQFMMDIPTLAARTGTSFLLTSHFGKDLGIQQGPGPMSMPQKKTQYLKGGEKLKGATEKAYYLMDAFWHIYKTEQLINQGTKGPEYPRTQEENKTGDPLELNIIHLKQIRGKGGSSGYTISIIVSQQEGVLPELSQFHYIKTHDRFGISGTLQSYHLDIYPDVNLSRTTLREKIDTDYKLRRAIEITSDLLQVSMYYPQYREDGLYCTPEELYRDIKDMGYDWDVLLNTRRWWTYKQYDHELPYLSIIDLLKMRKGLYKPYWYKEGKKKK